MENTKSLDKAELVVVEIKDMAEDGAGIGHTEEGMAVFVNGAVFGDKVKARITKSKKNYAFADALEVLEPSPHRAKDSDATSVKVCKYIDECGGCAFGRLNYETQFKLKEKHVADKLERIAGIENPQIMPIIGMTQGDLWPNHYRNKAVVAVYQDSNGVPYVGFRGRKSHKVIDCDYCMIQAPTANAAVKALRDYLINNRAPINQMTVKTAFGTGEVMVILHVKGKGELPNLEDFCYDLEDEIQALNDIEITETEEGRCSSSCSISYSLESVVLEREYVVKEGGKKGPLKTFNK